MKEKPNHADMISNEIPDDWAVDTASTHGDGDADDSVSVASRSSLSKKRRSSSSAHSAMGEVCETIQAMSQARERSQQSIVEVQQQRAEASAMVNAEKAKKLRLEAALTAIQVENARMKQISELSEALQTAKDSKLPDAYIAHLQRKLDGAIAKSMEDAADE